MTRKPQVMPSDKFAQVVEANRNAPAVPIHDEYLQTPAGSVARIRARGGFITQGVLIHPRYRLPQSVFYSGADITAAELPASHFMEPVKHNDGPGGQHGAWRWVDYRRIKRTDPDQAWQGVILQADSAEGGPSLTRAIMLEDSSLRVASSLKNNGPDTLATSIGHHDYYVLPRGDYDGLRINARPLDDILGVDDASGALRRGEALAWPGFNGAAEIRLADDIHLQIAAVALNDAKPCANELAMLVWSRSPESICFEPVWGFSEQGNRNLSIAPGAAASLMVTTTHAA